MRRQLSSHIDYLRCSDILVFDPAPAPDGSSEEASGAGAGSNTRMSSANYSNSPSNVCEVGCPNRASCEQLVRETDDRTATGRREFNTEL